MEPNNNIGYLLQHLAHAMARQNDQVLQERLGIGYSQFKILMVLDRHPYVQQRQIAEALGQTEASISRQIKLMTDRGLLQSTVSEANRRQHITTLTGKGIRLGEEAMNALNNYHYPMFERLKPKDQEQLMKTMLSMHEYVCQSGKSGACDKPFNT